MTATPIPRTVPAIRVRLDDQLMLAAYPLDHEIVDAILAAHGPERWDGTMCRACGYVYTPSSQDCPSVVVALAGTQ